MQNVVKKCVANNVSCVDMRDNWNSSYLIDDGLHLSAQGNQAYFDIVYNFIEKCKCSSH